MHCTHTHACMHTHTHACMHTPVVGFWTLVNTCPSRIRCWISRLTAHRDVQLLVTASWADNALCTRCHQSSSLGHFASARHHGHYTRSVLIVTRWMTSVGSRLGLSLGFCVVLEKGNSSREVFPVEVDPNLKETFPVDPSLRETLPVDQRNTTWLIPITGKQFPVDPAASGNTSQFITLSVRHSQSIQNSGKHSQFNPLSQFIPFS